MCACVCVHVRVRLPVCANVCAAVSVFYPPRGKPKMSSTILTTFSVPGNPDHVTAFALNSKLTKSVFRILYENNLLYLHIFI